MAGAKRLSARIRQLIAHEGPAMSQQVTRTLALLVVAVFLFLTSVHAQKPDRPAFTAASVRPETPDSRSMSFKIEGGRFISNAMPLLFLIQTAYSILPTDLKPGYPKWIESERYSINATSERNASASEVREMLQVLFED